MTKSHFPFWYVEPFSFARYCPLPYGDGMIHKLLSYSLALASILLLSSCGDSSKSHKSYESKVQCVENKVAETAKSMGTLETLSPEQTMQLTEKIAEFPKACEMTEEEQKKYFSKNAAKATDPKPASPQKSTDSNPPSPKFGSSASEVLATLADDDACRLRFIEKSEGDLIEGLHVFAGKRRTRSDSFTYISDATSFLNRAAEAGLCRKIAEPCNVLYRNIKGSYSARSGYNVQISGHDLIEKGNTYSGDAAAVLKHLIKEGVCLVQTPSACRIIFYSAGEIDADGGYFVIDAQDKPLRKDGFRYLSDATAFLETLKSNFFCAP